MTSGIDSTSASTSATQAATSPTKLVSSGNEQLANKETFLKLLVAQIKNQDPTSPSDGIQFLTQLAQFSSLEQSMQTNAELTTIQQTLANKPDPTTTQTQGNS